MDDQHVNPYNAGPVQIPELLAPGSAMASPTSVEFDLALDDLVAWNWYKAMSSPGSKRQIFGLRRLLLILCILITESIPVLYILDAVEYSAPADPLAFLWFVFPHLALLALVFVAYLYFLPLYRKIIRYSLRGLYPEQAEHPSASHRRLEISATGLVQKGKFFESRLSWPAIDRIAEEEKHVFFDAGIVGEMIVPRSAFSHDVAFQAFIAAARNYHKQAAQTPTAA